MGVVGPRDTRGDGRLWAAHVHLTSPPSYRDVRYVAERMRQWDRREIFACRWDDDAEALAQDTVRALACGYGYCTSLDQPVAVFGAAECWPGVWQVAAFATDEWPRVALGVTRFIRRTLIATLYERGAHRAECRSMEGHHWAHRWLLALGAQREAVHPGYGRAGETFVTFAWSRDDVRIPLRRLTDATATAAPTAGADDRVA